MTEGPTGVKGHRPVGDLSGCLARVAPLSGYSQRWPNSIAQRVLSPLPIPPHNHRHPYFPSRPRAPQP